jgi:hypothetical protein
MKANKASHCGERSWDVTLAEDRARGLSVWWCWVCGAELTDSAVRSEAAPPPPRDP